MVKLKLPEKLRSRRHLNRSMQGFRTMKIKGKTVVLALAVAALSLSPKAYAEPKPWVWSWWESHWDNLDFVPYLEEGKHPHNSQWNGSNWEPEHWVAQRSDGVELVQDFYTADIIRSQYVDDEIPVLEVGPAFYMLGGQDKRRVIETVDRVYGITSSKENGMFMLTDWRTREAIGAYTQYGLQLQ